MTNRLAQEASPYLLQHKDNPVDWYPWGQEAFRKAREEDRPILLSIGYSSCHWCHVMERESFDDRQVAEFMNAAFVNVKVDREERPDVDSVYMKAVQAMTGHGGWPLTAFLTPDGTPYYGGTYFPPQPRHGMPSFLQVLDAASQAYRNRKDEVEKAAAEMRDLLERASRPGRSGTAPNVGEGSPSEADAAAGEGAPATPPVDDHLLNQAAASLMARFDPVHGGFGSAPKFPQPVTLAFLLRRHHATGRKDLLDAVLLTLRKMARGGIRDHLGGGFHRYSVDARWLVPHFEKMLYDNALLAGLCLEAYQLTGDEEMRRVVEDTLDYVLTDLQDPDGGFYSARDADSEGEEGTFYVWTPDQVDRVLGEEDGPLFRRVYDVSPAGNFEGKNILHLPHDPDALARQEGMAREELDQRLAGMRKKLEEARREREHPFRDEKILTGWNGLMIRTLAEAGAVLNRDDYRDAALKAAGTLTDALWKDGRLLRVLKDGEGRIHGFLEDYAALGNALLTLHETTLEPRWLQLSVEMAEKVLELFLDEEEGILFDSPSDGEALVVRPRDPTDTATPSGNSLAVELLLRLGALLDRSRYRERADALIRAESEGLRRLAGGFGWLLAAAERLGRPGVEVAVMAPRTGDGAERTRELIHTLHRPFLPNKVVTGQAPEDEAPAVPTPLLKGREARNGQPTVYVCQGYSCRAPVTEPEELERTLHEVLAGGEPGGGSVARG